MIRAKINAKLEGDLIHVTAEWVDVLDSVVGEVNFKEEFKLAVDRPDCAYLSRVAIEQAEVLPGTFWVDESGKRHFFLSAEPGKIDQIGIAAEVAAKPRG